MHKPFRLILSTLCLLTAACSFNPNVQGKGEEYLQGEWQQDSTPVQKQLLSYSLYKFKFTCDSFFVQQQTISKINYGTDSCTKSGRWTEYMGGTYKQQHDTLFLKGFFTNADYSLKELGGCLRSGDYKEFFKVNKQSDSVLQLTGTASLIPVNIHLINKLTCKVKPL
ncbi:MAG: fumarate hydratase [Mucilaginibacter sp.]